MKHAKKLLGLLLALVMVLSLTTTAFAAQEGTLTGGSITINDAVAGQQYSIYQILYLESYNSDTGAYAYKANSAWAAWLAEDAQKAYVAIDDQGYVTWVENASAEDFAKVAKEHAKTLQSADGTVTAESNTVTFQNLNLGYYLVDTTLGTLCSLDTTNPNAEMQEKNEVPTNVKTVQEDSSGAFGTLNDAEIGQAVTFKSTITLPKGSENVVYHDTMSEGLTLDTTTIKVYTNEDMTTELEVGEYEVNADPNDTCTFDISFNQDYLNGLDATATVYVKYSATLNSSAVIGGNGNSNTSKLGYGDSSNTKYTPVSTTITYTWEMDVLKHKQGEESTLLEGAEFVLLNSNKKKVATFTSGTITGWVDVPNAGTDGKIEWPVGTIQTTNDQGKISVKGLDSTDKYYLREVKAPAGYNLLNEDKEVVINATVSLGAGSGSMSQTALTEKIANATGTELPSTGGMGTTIFYVVGSILLVGAAVLLITKKRMSAVQ